MTVALVDGDTIAFGHVGDSRAYRVRGGVLEQLTDDHSLVGELVRSGRLSPEEAESHPQRSVITRALGTEPDVDVDTFTIQAEPDDLYLLCSDGLTDMVSPRELQSLLVAHASDLDATARALVDAANAGGGEDNITVVLFQIAGAADPDETKQMPVAVVADRARAGRRGHALGARPGARSRHGGDLRRDRRGAAAAARAAAGGGPESGPEPAKPRRRLAPLILLILLLVAIAVLAVWGLTR